MCFGPPFPDGSFLCFFGIVNLSKDTYSPRTILDEYFRASGGQHDTVSLSSLALVPLRSLLAFFLWRFLHVLSELGKDEVVVVSLPSVLLDELELTERRLRRLVL